METLLETIKKDSKSQLRSDRERVIKNIHTPSYILDEMYYDELKLYSKPNPNVISVVARKTANQEIIHEILDTDWGESLDVFVKKQLIANINVSKDIIERLRNHKNIEIAYATISSSVCDSDEVKIQIMERAINKIPLNGNVIFYMAMNPITPGHILEKIYENNYYHIDRSLSEHKNTPPHILEMMFYYYDDMCNKLPVSDIRYNRNSKRREIFYEIKTIDAIFRNICRNKNTPEGIRNILKNMYGGSIVV